MPDAVVPGDPGDSDGCRHSFATAFRWDAGAGPAGARMGGLRSTFGAGCR